MSKISEFLTKCRLCALITTKQTVVQLFNSNEAMPNTTEVCDIILNCLNIKITENDDLPVVICKKCHKTLTKINKFRVTCYQTNIKLRNELHSNITSTQEIKIKNNIVDDTFDSESTQIFCEPTIDVLKSNLNYWNQDNSDELVETNKVVVSEGANVSEEQNRKVKEKIRHRPIKICEICGKSIKKFANHMNLHLKKRFPCPLCSNSYSQKPSLKTHLLTHGEKTYKCEHCDMLFACYGYLKRHRVVHTGERNFVCEICKKAFQTNYNLKTHVRTHTKEKPFKCEQCCMAFAHRATFNIHRKECKM